MLHPHVFQPGKNIIKHIIFSMARNTHEGTKITIFIIFIYFNLHVYAVVQFYRLFQISFLLGFWYGNVR